ncbi:MAG: class I SAM-dependent methyltransferase [Pseudomonadota bacterium]
MDLKEEQAIGGDPAAHWYYISKGRAIRSLIGEGSFASLLDVGAGSGVFSRMLTRDGVADEAVCVDPNYTDEWLAEHREGAVRYVRSVAECVAPLVLMIDVIEHVDDDVALISGYAQIAKPGTKFLISVPAFNFLWSSHDDFLEHRRRYTLETLERAVEAAGLEPLTLRYFFGMLFPAVAAMRIADRVLKGGGEAKESAMRAAPDWLTKTLVAIHDVERATLFPLNRLAGVTAFCLAEKPAALAKAADAA